MTRRNNRISELQILTGLALRAAQSEMSRLRVNEAALRQNLTALTVQKAQPVLAVLETDNLALIAEVDLRWQHWVDQRRAVVNTELAQVLASADNCQRRLSGLFGRDQVAQSLAAQARKQKKMRAIRAAAYES